MAQRASRTGLAAWLGAGALVVGIGVTAIPFRHFVAATFFGIIPGAALYTYLGVLGNLAGDGGPAEWALFGAGLMATIAVVILVARKARAKLREAGVDRPAA